MRQWMQGLSRWTRHAFRHLPERPFPSDHPWADRHDPSRPRG
jgi:hypothetical protein